ncbi:MAG TPA: molybdopterin converting factor subunit 1 [Anaerolineales bacterium]|nr:molybdopterin converting factor subunit 1 [Anaerolineales bacterium]
MNTIKLLFFATLRDRVGTNTTDLAIPDGLTVSGLKSLLTERYPSAAPTLDTAIVAVNKEFAFDTDIIPAGAEIAIFPPVSGG